MVRAEYWIPMALPIFVPASYLTINVPRTVASSESVPFSMPIDMKRPGIHGGLTERAFSLLELDRMFPNEPSAWELFEKEWPWEGHCVRCESYSAGRAIRRTVPHRCGDCGSHFRVDGNGDRGGLSCPLRASVGGVRPLPLAGRGSGTERVHVAQSLGGALGNYAPLWAIVSSSVNRRVAWPRARSDPA